MFRVRTHARDEEKQEDEQSRRIRCPLGHWSTEFTDSSCLTCIQQGDLIKGFLTLSFKEEVVVKDISLAINGVVYDTKMKKIAFFVLPAVLSISQGMRAYSFRTTRRENAEVAVRFPRGSTRLPLELLPLLPHDLLGSIDYFSMLIKTTTLTLKFLNGGRKWSGVSYSSPFHISGATVTPTRYRPVVKEAFGYMPFSGTRRLFARLSLTKQVFVAGEVLRATLLLRSTPAQIHFNDCEVTLYEITQEGLRCWFLGWKEYTRRRQILVCKRKDCTLMDIKSPLNLTLDIPTRLKQTFKRSYRRRTRISYMLRVVVRYEYVKKITLDVEIVIRRPETHCDNITSGAEACPLADIEEGLAMT